MRQSAGTVRNTVEQWLEKRTENIRIGLPEYDDRLGLWRVPLVAPHNGKESVGEVRVEEDKVVFSTNLELAKKRCKHIQPTVKHKSNSLISFRPIPSQIVLGDAADVLSDYPINSIQLIFTSPPYFNAKPECHESEEYSDYLNMLRNVFTMCHDILSEGRFLVVNTSPVLVRRPNRNASSRRIPITFDLHRVLDEIGYEFIDDIIWQKPEGAGWNLGRGRRFAADRQPLQYKPVTITENIVVYRKRTEKLLDWNIRHHPDQNEIKASLISDDYEKTNIWKIHPGNHKEHPAVFPDALAERVIKYYSFRGDMVLDPFSGTGTVGRVSGKLGRRFMLVENSQSYFNIQLKDTELIDHKPLILDYQYYSGVV